MKTVWDSFALAWNFLTIIPLPWSNQAEVHPVRLASSFRWYPFVGFLLGTFLVLSDRVFSIVLAEPVVNLLLVTLLVMVTGGLHQDGLADTIDAVAGGKNTEDRLAILRDCRIGAIGATGLVLALGLRYMGMLHLPSGVRESCLWCLPAIGRWSMVMGSWGVRYPRLEGGIAAPFIQHLTIQDILLGTITIGIGLVWAMGVVQGLVVMLGACVVAKLLVLGATRLFGGVTGDILGLTNEISEILFLLAVPLLLVLP